MSLERTPDCIDDDLIAALADGREFAGRAEALAHVSECSYCRLRVAEVARLLADPAVAAEIAALERPARAALPRFRKWYYVAGAGLAAAAAFVVLNPGSFDDVMSRGQPAHRESAITSADAPRIITPSGLVRAAGSMHWTSVSGADAYRIRVWNRNGDVVWSGETKDTVLALPPEIERGIPYLWEVNARTGWDRWTSSEFVEFTIDPAASR